MTPDLPERHSRSAHFDFAIRGLLIAAIFAAAIFGLRRGIEAGWMVEEMQVSLGHRMKPLPPITEWAWKYRTVFIFAAFFSTTASLATCALRDREKAYCALLGLVVFAGLFALLMYAACRLPHLPMP